MTENNGKAAEQVNREVEQRLAEIEHLEEQARRRGLAFEALDADQLKRKITGETSSSPYIYAASWTSGSPPGITASYNAYVSNPDAVGYGSVFGTIWFGLGNHFAQASDSWIGRYRAHWPAHSTDDMFIASGASATFAFSYEVPDIEKATYNGNSIIWQSVFNGRGNYFDRGAFYLTIF